MQAFLAGGHLATPRTNVRRDGLRNFWRRFLPCLHSCECFCFRVVEFDKRNPLALIAFWKCGEWRERRNGSRGLHIHKFGGKQAFDEIHMHHSQIHCAHARLAHPCVWFPTDPCPQPRRSGRGLLDFLRFVANSLDLGHVFFCEGFANLRIQSTPSIGGYG